MNNRIPSSAKVSSPYTNTFVAIAKVYVDNMTAIGAPSIVIKGGEQFIYATRLTIQLGGVIKAATKRLTATAKGETYTYGLITKIKVSKNQLQSPYTLTYEGTFCCVPDGMVSEEELDNYKKTHIAEILGEIRKRIEENSGNASDVDVSDIQFAEEDSND